MDKNTYIYVLIDPRTQEVSYIGKSDKPNRRYRYHLQDCNKKRTLKNNWIKSLLNKNLKPTLEIIDKVSYNEWQFWEQHYISLYKSWGFKLKNMTIGGDGGKLSEQSLLKRKHTISQRTAEEKEKVSKNMALVKIGKKIHSQEYKERLRKEKLGIPLTEQVKQNMRISAAIRFGNLTEEKRVELRQRAAKCVGRKVVQYSLSGNKIKEFNSITEARRNINCRRNLVNRVCSGKQLFVKDFIFRYLEPRKGEPKNTVESILEAIKLIKTNA